MVTSEPGPKPPPQHSPLFQAPSGAATNSGDSGLDEILRRISASAPQPDVSNGDQSLPDSFKFVPPGPKTKPLLDYGADGLTADQAKRYNAMANDLWSQTTSGDYEEGLGNTKSRKM